MSNIVRPESLFDKLKRKCIESATGLILPPKEFYENKDIAWSVRKSTERFLRRYLDRVKLALEYFQLFLKGIESTRPDDHRAQRKLFIKAKSVVLQEMLNLPIDANSCPYCLTHSGPNGTVCLPDKCEYATTMGPCPQDGSVYQIYVASRDLHSHSAALYGAFDKDHQDELYRRQLKDLLRLLRALYLRLKHVYGDKLDIYVCTYPSNVAVGFTREELIEDYCKQCLVYTGSTSPVEEPCEYLAEHPFKLFVEWLEKHPLKEEPEDES